MFKRSKDLTTLARNSLQLIMDLRLFQRSIILMITISHTLCRGHHSSTTVLLVSWTTLHSIHYFAFFLSAMVSKLMS